MFDALFIMSIVGAFVQIVKEKIESTIPEENWANKELMNKDRINNMSHEQWMKNLESGKYKQTNAYQEPHRDIDKKIIIENCKLYNEDIIKYDAVQIGRWIKQGRYNLSPEELKKENERIQAHIDKLYDL